MADKDFVVKNGIVVSNNLIYAPAGGGEVGINTTSPTANLHVVGTGFFSTTLTANIVQANSISTNSISSSSLSLTGNMNIGGSLTVTNDLAISRNFGVSGNTNLVGNVTIAGTTSLVNLSGTIGSFSNVSISNFGNIQNANLTNLTVSTSTNISGTATFNNAVVAGFTPTATNHLINAGYANTTFVRADGKNAFSANITISSTAPTIILNDTDHSDFRIHCNSNLAGFLKSDLNWANYTDQSGNFTAAGNINAGGNLSAVGSMSAASLAGGASTGTGASGTWPINITGNAANGRTKIGEWNMSSWSAFSDANLFNTIGAGYNSFELELIGVYPTSTYEGSWSGVGAHLILQMATGGVMQGVNNNEYRGRLNSAEGGWQGNTPLGFIPATWYGANFGRYGRVTQNALYRGVTGKFYFQNVKDPNGYKIVYGDTSYWNLYYYGSQTDSFSATCQFSGALSGFQFYFYSYTTQRNMTGLVRLYAYY